MTDFVLLHGTTQSPRGWDRLVDALDDRGHISHLVDLESSEDRDAEAYALQVRRQVPEAVARPVVVAHSGAGLLLPAAARALGAARQVWLAAVVPDGRHALLEEMRADPATVFNPEWIGQDPTVDPVLACYFLFHDADLATLRWGLTTLRRFVPARLQREPVATRHPLHVHRLFPGSHPAARLVAPRGTPREGHAPRDRCRTLPPRVPTSPTRRIPQRADRGRDRVTRAQLASCRRGSV